MTVHDSGARESFLDAGLEREKWYSNVQLTKRIDVSSTVVSSSCNITEVGILLVILNIPTATAYEVAPKS